MTQKTYLSSIQLMLLVVGCALMTAYTHLPLVNTPPANQDTWVVALLSFFYAVILSVPIYILTNRFRGVAFSDFLESILGGALGKTTSILYALYFLFIYVVSMLIAVGFISIFIIPDTSIWLIMLFLVLPTAYLAYKGVGTLGRIATFVVPYVLLTIVFFLLLGIDIMDFEVLGPVLADSNFFNLNFGAFITGSKVSEVLMFILLVEYIYEKTNINKSITWALAVLTIFIALILVPTLSVLGIDIAKHAWNPYYLYTRQVQAYDFIQRVESLNALGWFMGTLLKLAAYNFMASYALSGIFKKKNHKILVPIISLIGGVAVLLPFLNTTDLLNRIRTNEVIAWATLPFTVGIPLLLIVVYLFRKKTVDEEIEQIKNNE